MFAVGRILMIADFTFGVIGGEFPTEDSTLYEQKKIAREEQKTAIAELIFRNVISGGNCFAFVCVRALNIKRGYCNPALSTVFFRVCLFVRPFARSLVCSFVSHMPTFLPTRGRESL